MNIGSTNSIVSQSIMTGNGLRKAASSTDMPQLTDDESRMINKQFTGQASTSISFYKGNGDKMEQMFASRGQHIDVTI